MKHICNNGHETSIGDAMSGRCPECDARNLARGIAEASYDAPVIRRNGPRYKRFMSDEGIAIELFIADANASNFGNILAIRTGNADDRRKWPQSDGTIALVGVFTPAELRDMADDLEALQYARWAEQAAKEEDI